MDDLDLHLALEALRTNPAAHAYHERITRGMQAIEQGTLTPFERDALHRLLERFPVSMPPSPDPVAALIAAFQAKMPTYDSADVATAIQQALAQRPATLNGAPVTITMDGDTHAHQANLAIGNQVGGNLVQVTVTIPIPDARFDALLASALRTHEHEKTLDRVRHAAHQIESDRLLNLRLQGFVGRVTELAAIREHIEAMRPTGGYVLIKAAAGEGKSSSIAKLIQETGIAQTPHHFIALTTGREYQLGLLRAVVAQLILKHHLTVSYFPEESYPAMKGEFARILGELSKQGIHETIYLDGLDQLQPEIDGSRDLSFLPPQPPPGIVIVLGSRPDETLKPLKILHRVDYPLPRLSEDDALALWRSVQPGVADGLLHDLYAALKGNALFVHLAADTMQGQSVVDAMSLIRQIEQNPSNLFGITLERIKNRSELRWPTIWRPMVALLVVTQEPLLIGVIGRLLGQPRAAIQDAVRVMGGLVSQGNDQRVALHHLLFRDYVQVHEFDVEELRAVHQRLADWCANDLEVIWADHADPIELARRRYARQHYVTHLALAENWPTLWRVLDAGDYGEHKTRFDPSTRLYALDLDRGRESAIKAGQSTEEHIQNLPRLWKYSLLRTSLTSRVDQWPDDLFVTLAMLGRTQEALERIELISDPERQIMLWEAILEWSNRQQQKIILNRMQQLESLSSSIDPSRTLMGIAKTMAILNNTEQALATVLLIEDRRYRTTALTEIAQTFVKQGDTSLASELLGQAFIIAQSIDDKGWCTHSFAAIAKITATLGNIDQALTIAQSIDDKEWRTHSLAAIANTAATLGNIDQALVIIYLIDSSLSATDALITVAQTIAMMGNIALAGELFNNARMGIQSLDTSSSPTEYALIAKIMAKLGHTDQALIIAQSIDIEEWYMYTLESIVRITAKLGHIDRAIIIAQSIIGIKNRINAMAAIARTIAITENISYTHNLVNRIIATTQITVDKKSRTTATVKIAEIIGTLGNINQALSLIRLVDVGWEQMNTLKKIARIITKRGTNLYDLQLLEKTIAHIQPIEISSDQYEICTASNSEQNGSLYDQVIVLTSIAEINAIFGDLSRAMKILNQAFIVAKSISNKVLRPLSFRNISDTAAILGDIDQAFDIASSIDDPSQQMLALQGIVQNTSTVFDNVRARKFFNRAFASDTSSFNIAAQTAAVLGDIDHAIVIAQPVDIPSQRDEILCNIVKIAASLGSIGQALDTTQLINTLFYRTIALITITQAVAHLGDMSYAHNLLSLTTMNGQLVDSSSYEVDIIQSAIAETTAMLGDIKRALMNSLAIDNPYRRVNTIINCIQMDTTAAIALPIIHKEWASSTTYNLTWQCLPLIIPLLKDNLWLVEYIFDHEAWVNDQLKRLG